MRTLVKLLFILIFFQIFSCGNIFAKSVYYIIEGGIGDGTSWQNASGSIQDMIDKSISGDEVWVAKGTYYPTKEMIARNDRSKTFLLKEGVNLFGGFSGFETSISQRALSDKDGDGVIKSYELTNTTCLSGDIDGIADIWIKKFNSDSITWNFSIVGNEGNCGHVVYGSDFTKPTYFDGFTVTGGNADRNSFGLPCGGGIYSKSKLYIENCIISNCTTSDCGGGVYFQYDSEIKNSYIYNCSSSIYGGGILSQKTVLGCDISDCSALISGGGIYLFPQNTIGSISVSNTKINNCSSSTGGGIYIQSSSNTIYLDNCIISNCSTSKFGGGVHIINYSTTLYARITNCNISNCTSFGDGGGIMAEISNSSYIKNCTLTECKSFNNGGGIYSRCLIENCLVDNCNASNNGGGIFSSTDNVSNCIINNCSASNGGGLYSYYSNVIKCKINNCIASDYGGGIYSLFSYRTVDYKKINNFITNCIVSNCLASNGGGIYSVSILNSASDVKNITNCTVYNCTAVNSGGGIYADYNINTNNRSLMYSYVTNCSVNNCIASNDGCAIYTPSFGRFYSYISNCSTSSYIKYESISDIFGGIHSGNINPELSTTFIKPTNFVGMTKIDSLLKELNQSDWHLCENSQCIDAGIKSEYSDYTDYDGQDRIQGRTIDIGAYEYNSLSTFKTVKMPVVEDFDNCTSFSESGILYDAATIDSYDIKWKIEDKKALFDWNTNLYSYNQAFFTYLIDATDATSVFLEYDMYFKAYSGSITSLGTEKLKVEYSTDLKKWSPVATYSNINGTIENQKYSHDISSIAAGKKFSIRFNANGENSNRIEKWEIDNIEIKSDRTSNIKSPTNAKYLLIIQNNVIYFSNLAGKSISIYDTSGKKLYQEINAQESERYKFNKSGIYIVVIDNYIEKILIN